MVRQIRSGRLDFVGAARPSIADPFLPTKIREGRLEDIRECIGCNICYAHNYRGAALRCTQNPTMGEEWRSGWHPESVPAGPGGTVLVVGAGPAGLEAALTLGRRGYSVALADAAPEPGGRVSRESRLPGLAEWARVRDYRVGQLKRMSGVSLYLGQALSAADVRDFGADHVIIATGARWRRDGRGRTHSAGIANLADHAVYTPDDLMRGTLPTGAVTVYDDDHYYMGPVLALLLAREGRSVTYVTAEGRVAAWSHYTGEQEATHAQLLANGVRVRVNTTVAAFDGARLDLSCAYSAAASHIACEALVLVTSREPDEALYRELVGEDPGDDELRIQAIGDCAQPALIAHAVYAGHKAARELDGQASPAPRDRLVV